MKTKKKIEFPGNIFFDNIPRKYEINLFPVTKIRKIGKRGFKSSVDTLKPKN